MSKVYVGDVGTRIELETGVSLAGATTLQIKVKKPDATLVTWAATASGSKLVYTVLANDLDTVGTWLLQARVVLPSGAWLGESASLRVHDPFQ